MTCDPVKAVLVLYVDGEEVDKVFGVPRQEFNIRHIRLGTWHEANQAFRGYLDEIKVYDYIRSEDEILIEAYSR